MAATVSKASAQYSKGMPSAHCGICTHYSNHRCEIVVGEIDPAMWCKFFAKREGLRATIEKAAG
jgi:dihydroorotase